MNKQQMTPHQALSFLCSAIRCGEVFDGHHSQAAEIIRAALSHAEGEAVTFMRTWKSEPIYTCNKPGDMGGTYCPAPQVAGLTETAIKSSPAYRALHREKEHLLGLLKDQAPQVAVPEQRDDMIPEHFNVDECRGFRTGYNYLRDLLAAPTAPAGEAAGWPEPQDAMTAHLQDAARKAGYQPHEVDERLALFAGYFAGRGQPVSDPDGLVIGWATLREGDPTFPHFHKTEERADAEIATCNVYPAIAKAPVYLSAPTAPAGELVTRCTAGLGCDEKGYCDAAATGQGDLCDRRTMAHEQPVSDPDGFEQVLEELRSLHAEMTNADLVGEGNPEIVGYCVTGKQLDRMDWLLTCCASAGLNSAPAPDEREIAHRWINGCDDSVPAALRFLAANERPAGGEQQYNAEHLLQLADELDASIASLRAGKEGEPS